MLRLCNGSGKDRVKNMDSFSQSSTLSTESKSSFSLNPQIIQNLHNFSTQFSTAKNTVLTDKASLFSTLSTDTITTTTIIYKEG